LTISGTGEFELIKRIGRSVVNRGGGLIVGIGDDAAVLQITAGKRLLVTTDMLVEGIHFVLGKITPFQLGRKALAVSLSDMAAMGAYPRHAFISTGWSEAIDIEYVDAFYGGLQELADRWSVNIAGGDTTGAPVVVVDVCVLGEADPDAVVMRNGARPGDLVMVTGYLGGSAAGLDLLMGRIESEGLSDADVDHCLQAHLLPVPRVAESQELVKTGAVTAMMDISDGLAGEINHICDHSRVGVCVWEETIPIHASVRRAAAIAGIDPLTWALAGGEDYELVFTAPAATVKIIETAVQAATGTKVTVIGEILDPGSGRTAVRGDGARHPLAGGGYDHFRSKEG